MSGDGFHRILVQEALVKQEIKQAPRSARLFVIGVVIGMAMGILLMLFTS